MLRFAPDTTDNMSINDLRIALLNYQTAKQRDEEFIVRLKEDNQQILEILSLFDIQYSQVIYQDKNTRFYSAMALQLLHEKKAFNCFCSNEWIEKKRQEALEAKKPYLYDDACRNLPPELVIDNTNPFVVRIKRPEGDNSTESFVILNQDKTPTQQFASAVDDMLSDISVVIAEESQQKNCQQQQYIRDQLGYNKKIEYIYVSKIDTKDGHEISVRELLEAGYLPQAISNYLLSEALNDVFNIDVLGEFNRDVLVSMDNKELSRYVGFADDDIGALAKLFLDDVTTTKQLKQKIEPVFEKREIPQELYSEYEKLRQIIKELPYFETFEEFIKAIGSTNKQQTLLYYLFLNTDSGPDIKKVYNCLKNYLGEIVKC